jgi:hypothetical protein
MSHYLNLIGVRGDFEHHPARLDDDRPFRRTRSDDEYSMGAVPPELTPLIGEIDPTAAPEGEVQLGSEESDVG